MDNYDSDELEQSRIERCKDYMKILEEKALELYKFRDHYFETHPIKDALKKSSDVEDELNKTLELFNEYKDCASTPNRARYYYLKGYVLNVLPKYSKEAEDVLSKAIKLDPKLVEAWNELGECYWKADNIKEAINCYNGALNYGKNKISLRSLSMLARQEKYNSFKEKAELVKKGLRLAKEAVQLDPHDGTSWAILGNAHLSSFFCCQQNPMTLKQCLSAYAQAEKDVVEKSVPELHFNKGVTLKYQEEFLQALESFSKAHLYDPTWEEPINKERILVEYLNEINEMAKTSGKMKAKRLQQLLKSIDSKQLGPYSGGRYTSTKGDSVKLDEVTLEDLKPGINEEKVVLGKVVCSVRNEDSVPFTFCLVDKLGTCVVVTVFNLAVGKGVKIGDSVAIPEPYVTDYDFEYKSIKYEFRLLRLETPLVLVVNGKKVNRGLQAGVQMSLSQKFD